MRALRLLLLLAVLLGVVALGDAQVRVQRGYVSTVISAAQQSVTVNGATTFVATSSYVLLACTGAETINTITGGAAGQLLILEHTDTECTIADDETATAANAVDLTGAADDAGAVNKILVLLYNGTYWMEVSESDN